MPAHGPRAPPPRATASPRAAEIAGIPGPSPALPWRSTLGVAVVRAVFFRGTGDASILELRDVAAREPGADEARVRVTSCGLNRADANYRAGKYLLRTPGESRSGFEGAGVVDVIGA